MPMSCKGRLCISTEDCGLDEIKRLTQWIYFGCGEGRQPHMMTVDDLKQCATFTDRRKRKRIKCLIYFGLADVINNAEALLDCLSTMTGLRQLTIRRASFKEVPEAIRKLRKLTQLNLCDNAITHIPSWLGQLDKLEELNLWRNELTSLDSFPHMASLKILNLRMNKLTRLDLPSTSNLEKVEHLNLIDNGDLASIPSEFIDCLPLLWVIECELCQSLCQPPLDTCMLGIDAIRRYYEQLKQESSTVFVRASVVVMGEIMAGKTSLVQSLCSDKRICIPRLSADDGTIVANVEKVGEEGSGFTCIDFGGHPVYHHTYSFSVRDNCIPLFVIDITKVPQNASAEETRKQVNRLLFRYISRVYNCCPNLGPPLLAVTHTDMLSVEEVKARESVLLDCLQYWKEKFLRDQELFFGSEEDSTNIENLDQSSFKRSKSIVKEFPLFRDGSIFKIGRDDTANIFALKKCLEHRVQEGKQMKIPPSWKNVMDFVLGKAESYVKYEDVEEEFKLTVPTFDLALSHLHSTGIINWYHEKEKLRYYILHRFTEMSKFLESLFDHQRKEVWKKRIQNHLPDNDFPDRLELEHLVEQIETKGVVTESLLKYAIKHLDTRLPVHIGLELLKQFYIIHGPVLSLESTSYIVPAFCQMESDNTVAPLNATIKFYGLELPESAYHEIIVCVMNQYTDSSVEMKVHHSGVRLIDEDFVIRAIHSKENQEVKISVDNPAELIGEAWNHLIQITRAIRKQMKQQWPGQLFKVLVSCGHCVLAHAEKPAPLWDPQWASIDVEDSISGTDRAKCNCPYSANRIPALLRHPPASSPTPKQLEEYVNFRKELLPDSLVQPLLPAPLSPTFELIEVDIRTVPDSPTNSVLVLPTVNKDLISQFHKTQAEGIYPVTSPIRGRVLIINIETYNSASGGGFNQRVGSTCDVEKFKQLFSELHFEVPDPIVDSVNIQADMQREIVYQNQNRFNYGAFVLIIMSHGTKRGVVNHACQEERYADLFDLLHKSNFPCMASKPKLVFIQACTRDNPGGGYNMTDIDLTRTGPEDPHHWLDIHASFASFYGSAYRDEQYGSWFAEDLVEVFSKHAHDCHLIELLTKVRRRVSQRRVIGRDEALQLPFEPFNLLDRTLYFYPGLRQPDAASPTGPLIAQPSDAPTMQ